MVWGRNQDEKMYILILMKRPGRRAAAGHYVRQSVVGAALSENGLVNSGAADFQGVVYRQGLVFINQFIKKYIYIYVELQIRRYRHTMHAGEQFKLGKKRFEIRVFQRSLERNQRKKDA